MGWKSREQLKREAESARQTDWSYFRIERREAGQLMMLAPQGGAGAMSLDEQNEVMQSDDIGATPAATQTHKPSPTPTTTKTPAPLPSDQDASAPELANFAHVNFKPPVPVSAPCQ